MFSLSKFICNKLGHKEGWYPCPPWVCERCGADFKTDWDENWSQAHYERFEILKAGDEAKKQRSK